RRARYARAAASGPGGVRRRGGGAVRVLHERLDHDGGGRARAQPESDRPRDPRDARGAQVSMRNAHGDLARGAPCGGHARGGAVGGRAERRVDAVGAGGRRMSRSDTNVRSAVELALGARASDAARTMDRRSFLKGGAALVFSLGAGGGLSIVPIRSAEAQSRWAAARSTDPTQLDTWIAIAESGDVTAFFGKMDMGQGVDTAIAQVVAEELDEIGRAHV